MVGHNGRNKKLKAKYRNEIDRSEEMVTSTTANVQNESSFLSPSSSDSFQASNNLRNFSSLKKTAHFVNEKQCTSGLIGKSKIAFNVYIFDFI